MLWPREAVKFLRDLEDNNDRDWFKENKARYETFCAEPRDALAERLAPQFGRPKTFRPYHDTRFHQGPALKEQVGLAFGFGEGAGYYVEISLDGIFVAAGMWAPASDQVSRWRTAVEDKRRAGGVRKAIDTAGAAGMELYEADLKRGPAGMPADHHAADLLRHRRVVVSSRTKLGPWVHKPDAADKVEAQFAASKPMVTWLRKHVGPSTKQQAR